jgi:hypothetical protein
MMPQIGSRRHTVTGSGTAAPCGNQALALSRNDAWKNSFIGKIKVLSVAGHHWMRKEKSTQIIPE